MGCFPRSLMWKQSVPNTLSRRQVGQSTFVINVQLSSYVTKKAKNTFFQELKTNKSSLYKAFNFFINIILYFLKLLFIVCLSVLLLCVFTFSFVTYSVFPFYFVKQFVNCFWKHAIQMYYLQWIISNQCSESLMAININMNTGFYIFCWRL